MRVLPAIVAVSLGLAACTGAEETAAPTTVTSTTSTSAATPPPTPPAPRIETTAALLRAGDLGDEWALTDRSVAEVDPAGGFCGDFVSVRALDVLRTRAFASADGAFVVSGVATFTDAGASTSYLDAIVDTADCDSWTDGAGATSTVGRIAAPPSEADEVVALRQILELADRGSVVTDIVYVRAGRALSFATHTTIWRNGVVDDQDPTDDPPEMISRLVPTLTIRLLDAVAG